MKTSIPKLIIGDVIMAHGFEAKVEAMKHFDECSQCHLSFISGDKSSFNYLAMNNDNGFAVMQGNELATITLVIVAFEAE